LKNHKFLSVIGIAVIILVTAFSCSNSQEENNRDELPNVVLLMGDDHGWDEVGYNGHPFVKTPVLDEMAASGLRFDRFYSGHPSCSPTRGSLMTGRHPNRYGTFGATWSIRPEEISIAHVLISIAETHWRCRTFAPPFTARNRGPGKRCFTSSLHSLDVE
jgi:hypothetical protein